ncbi:SdiA-regulated domain-containing protein [Christiangramia echinicola]|uniref:SdiA-regulated n=1 Tax=Christiangramia echinicola TaxID=279359 RepID=A0A1H1KXC6_9FLAO|nr:SdiA-regulated domain-containing protein [Christiangramia echinicola]SDR66662.1 SdiA-regulated [Christiangramia echinicola]
MSMRILEIVVIILGLAGIVAFSFSNKFEKQIHEQVKESREYSVEKMWVLPEILEEVSGINFFANDKLAAVQDEDGIIFIYDLAKGEIEREIDFGGNGDYEAISIKEKDAFILRSDGVIFEVKDFLSSPQVTTYEPEIEHSVNFEGLCLSKKADKFLLLTKDEDVKNGVKNVYSFNLKSKQFEKDIPYKLETEKGIFKDYKGSFRPSEIEINPKTGEFYVLDAKHPRLLILNSTFQVLRLITFDEDEFEQPEGIGFDTEGRLYISNEAGDSDANILQVELKPVK